jgi:hypothetical protein
MITYKDMKSVAYFDRILSFVEDLLNIRFKKQGEYKYGSYCTFHVDKKDSLRVCVNKKEEVRFDCCGTVEGDSVDATYVWTKKGWFGEKRQEKWLKGTLK